jgi:hypothetical protein
MTLPRSGAYIRAASSTSVSQLLTFTGFDASARRRFPLQPGLIVINGGTDEIFQGLAINPIALEEIDRSPRAAIKAGVEELVGIREADPVGKGKLH